MKKVLILASVASMIDQFNMKNIEILKELGYEVEVAANFEYGSTSSTDRIVAFKKELDYLKITYHQIDFSRKITDLFQIIKAYKQIKKVLMKEKYEFIHCHSPIGGALGRLAAKRTKTKNIYTAHGFHFFKGAPLLNWLLYYPIEKILSYITDILITINQEDYMFARRNMNSKSIYYIPGVGIDINKFNKINVNIENKRKEIGITSNDIVILSVGELNKNKNHEIIIKSLSKINKGNVHYCIAGKGNLDKYLNELIESLNLTEKIHLLGYRDDIVELYKIADIFAFPSYREGLSVSLMEAMCVGLPVVCSDIRGNTDLIKDKKGGYLCNPISVNDFTENIETLLNDINLRRQMGEYNKMFITQFDYKYVSSKMKEIYDI